jgi:hypothetical protein
LSSAASFGMLRSTSVTACRSALIICSGNQGIPPRCAQLEGWRCVKVTDRHAAVDYAHVLKELSDARFPDAEKIVLVGTQF